MPTPGHFVLHSRAEPPLAAGDYVLRGTQQVAGGPTAPYEGHVRITSPRYRMPPDQILSTFPPANAEGAFELAAAADRPPASHAAVGARPRDARRDIPWLALVRVAEGEGRVPQRCPSRSA